MNVKEKQYVRDIIDQEGFDYAFTNYTDFHEVKDKEFHELKYNYLKSRKELENYIERENVYVIK